MFLRRADFDSLRERIDGIEQTLDVLVQRSELLVNRQVVQLSDQEFLGRTWYGWAIVPAQDVALFSWMLNGGGLIQAGTAKVFAGLLREGDTAIDVGAHIGTITMPAGHKVGARGLVIAVEPLPKAADILRRSAAINGMAPQIRVECCAAGAAAGTARLHVCDALSLNSLLPIAAETATIEVKVCPLDDLVPPSARVCAVKIDAEGYELQVWRGMQRLLDDNPELAMIVEFGPSHLERSGAKIDDWFDTFLSRGHRAYEIDEESGQCRPLRQTGLGGVFSLNILLLKRAPQAYPDLRVAETAGL